MKNVCFSVKQHLGCRILNGKFFSYKHLHKEIELFYLIKDEVKLYYNFEEYSLNPGDFAIIFPNVIHSFEENEPTDETNRMLSIFHKTTIPDLTPIFSNKCILGSPVISVKNMHPEVAFCIEQLISRESLRRDELLFKGYLTIILKNILENIELSDISTKNGYSWLQNVLMYLNENFTRDVSLDTLSQLVGVNKSYISSKFNKSVGCSIPTYINTLRVEHAIYLIQTTELPIIDIAFESGFESNASFFRAFKKMELNTPLSYRKIKM